MIRDPWLKMAGRILEGVVCACLYRCAEAVATGAMFGPEVFAAGALFTIALVIHSEWNEVIDLRDID